MRYFDVATAQQLVPTLAETFGRVRRSAERLRLLTQTLELHSMGGPVAADELEKMRTERDELVADVRQQIERLEEMGIEVKSLDGLADFRALRAGRQVYLCWQYGERTIGYWHELDGGLAGRRPIDDASAFVPAYLS